MARTVKRKSDTSSSDKYARDAVEDVVEEEYEDDEETSSSSGPGYNRDEIGTGWDSFEEATSSGGNYATTVKLKDDGDWVLGIALEDAPFAVYWRHWVQQMGQYKSTARKDNPLTAVGNKPQGRTAFNFLVVATSEDGVLPEPELRVLDAAPTLAKKLENIHLDDKKGPLSANYLEITVEKTESKGRKGGRTDYNVQSVKERDLEEDYDVTPPTEDMLEEFAEELFTKQDHPFLNTAADLEEAASLLASRAEGSDGDWTPPRARRSRR